MNIEWILEKIKNCRAFIAGDVMLDKYVVGDVLRLCPEAPVPVLSSPLTQYCLGGAANVAANIASVGAEAVLCGRVGDDFSCKIISNLLIGKRIDDQYLIVDNTVNTTTKTRFLSKNQHYFLRMDEEMNIALNSKGEWDTLKHFLHFVHEDKSLNKVLILSDYGKGFLTDDVLARLISIAHAHDVPIIVDPKSANVERYAGADIIKPNYEEAVKVSKCEPIAATYLARSLCKNIVMSMAEKGCYVMGEDCHEVMILPAFTDNVVDVSGAGDTMTAMLGLGLAADIPLTDNAAFANMAAGLVCTKKGTACIYPDDFFIS